MLKFLETRDEVVDLVHTVAEQPEMSSFKVGVAGSYVTSQNKKGSAIDIILKLKEGADKDLIGDLGINYFVRDYIARAYSNKIHIIWLDLLEADEEALLKFIGTEGVENNPESAYTNIVGEVRWVEDDEEDDEDADDRISSSVVTYDEEEDN